MRRLLVGLIQGYRYVISPWLSPACRFDPTCSQYAMDAIRQRGCLEGLGLTLIRLLKCHPFHAGGFDPVKK
ncbi:MAG: membrane protein insertion efficiency factor YidD [Nitrospira sp.]|nr:membrane protein insertion efficiency factor YidD [Nitrospira sp.]